MTDETSLPENEGTGAESSGETPGENADEKTHVELAYQGASQVVSEGGETKLAFFGNLKRDPVSLNGKLKNPLKIRESLATLYQIVGSDYRYVPKDRSRYIAYQQMKRESANLNLWQSQQAYFDWLWRNDPLAWLILDPIITVHPDGMLFEVFSKDEGTWANLKIGTEEFELAEEPTCGTTNIDFSENLMNGILQMRGYRDTTWSIGQEDVIVETEASDAVLEKQLNVPDTWLRGFLQVQSAATLPHETIPLAPVDLYNVLRHLRMHADVKGKRRGLRVELMPGEVPTLVLEPWGTVFKGTGGIYKGKTARVVRVWGRRRLMMLQRMLPYFESLEVHLLGSGLPSFWVMRAGAVTLTIGLTGFTAANWSQAASFDLLLPRKTQGSEELKQVVKHLSDCWFDSRAGIAKATGLKAAALLEALQLGCQQGQLMFDIAEDVYRLRPLTAEPLNLEKLEYRNQQERQAHDLLARKGAVTLESHNQIFGVGLELTGKVVVKEDKREYRPQFLLTDAGNVTRTECTCTFFRKQGLKAGPCTHLVALRLIWAEHERAANTAKARKVVTVETKTYSRRKSSGEEVYQISLDRNRVRIRWGKAGDDLRVQTLQFNSEDEARHDYLSRLDSLSARGYLDATTT